MMERIALRIFGIYPLLLVGDPGVWDRWVWLRKNLLRGNVRTLDAGCGSGGFSLGAARLGNVVVGLSFDERNNSAASNRSRILGLENQTHFFKQDLRRLAEVSPRLGLFEQIICCETIEHIKGDSQLLKDFSRILSPGGRLLLTAPYKFYRRLPGDSISDIENGGHVRWGYTHDEMKTLLAGAGLKLWEAGYVTGVISQLIIRLERVISFKVPHRIVWVLLFPLRAFTILDPILTGLLHYPRLSIGVVAVKE